MDKQKFIDNWLPYWMNGDEPEQFRTDLDALIEQEISDYNHSNDTNDGNRAVIFDMFDFLRWFVEFSNKFSRVRFEEGSKRWYFSIYNTKEEVVHIESFSGVELVDRYLEVKEEQK